MTTYILGLVISFAAGAWFIYKAPEKKQWIYLFLSAGGAYLITVLFTHILPELFENLGHTAGYVLLIGFIVQILLEKLFARHRAWPRPRIIHSNSPSDFLRSALPARLDRRYATCLSAL